MVSFRTTVFALVLLAAAMLSLPPSSSAKIVEVEMINLTFVPDSVCVDVGDTIRWTNNSAFTHTTTSGNPCTPDSIWTSAFLGPSTSFMAAFDVEGDFPYFCIPHCGFGMRGFVEVKITATGIGDVRPSTFALRQNHPNPFNPVTTISYDLAVPAHVQIEIYNALGKIVKSIENSEKSVGTYAATWDATNAKGERLASGIYFYQLRLDGVAMDMKKMVLLK